MKNLHAIEIKYLGPTNNKGSRVKLTSLRFNESKIISYDYSMNTIYDMAKTYLEEKGFIIVGLSDTKSGYILTSDTFESIK